MNWKQPFSDSKRWDELKLFTSQCNDCLFYYGSGKCSAYPEGIPEDVLKNHTWHNRELPGDHGIQYLKKES